MPAILSAFGTGLLFGLGLIVSQMVNPAKVLGFLDIFGHWDPSLAFVMGGAVAVSALGSVIAKRRGVPVLAARLEIPSRRDLDRRLIGGAAVFGIGWGLVGLCPGPDRDRVRALAGPRVRRRHGRRHGPVPDRAIRLAAGDLPAQVRRSCRRRLIQRQASWAWGCGHHPLGHWIEHEAFDHEDLPDSSTAALGAGLLSVLGMAQARAPATPTPPKTIGSLFDFKCPERFRSRQREPSLDRAHAPQGAIPQDELVPTGDQGVQTSEPQDHGSSGLMHLCEQAGRTLHRTDESGKAEAEERDRNAKARGGIPSGQRQADEEHVQDGVADLGRPIEPRALDVLDARCAAHQPGNEARDHEHQHGQAKGEVQHGRVLPNVASALRGEPGCENQQGRGPMQGDDRLRVPGHGAVFHGVVILGRPQLCPK
jgi:hypothetical protein